MSDGMLAIITFPDGDVLATAADFERQSIGGFKLAEAQERRALKFAKWEAFKKLCHPDVVKAMDPYDIEQAINAMVRKCGYKITCIPVSTTKTEAPPHD